MMSSSDNAFSSSNPLQPVITQWTQLTRQYQQILDRAAPHTLYRWLGFAGILSVFLLRIVLAQGVSLNPFFFGFC